MSISTVSRQLDSSSMADRNALVFLGLDGVGLLTTSTRLRTYLGIIATTSGSLQVYLDGLWSVLSAMRI